MALDDFKERVRETTDIVDVVSRFTALKTKGKTLVGICPLPGHTEKTPSFTVNPDLQFYYCFGCQRGGDVFKFAQEVMGHSFPEALNYFADKAGLTPPPRSGSFSEQSFHSAQFFQKKASLVKINGLAKDIFQKKLQDLTPNHPARIYLKNRGFSQKAIEAFQLGYAPNDWTFLSKKLSSYREAQILGLVRKKAGHQDYYDVYRNRIMFPIITIRDEVIGFGGRCLIESEQEAKYINSPTSDIFHKGKILYGLNLAATHIRSLDQVIVVEGYTDVMMLHQNGFKNVVGVLGTALTEAHARLLRRYTRNVIVLFDSDAAGKKASKKALPILLKADLYPKSLEMPPGEDPDQILQTWGREKFQKRLKEAPDLFECLLKDHLMGRPPLTPSTRLEVLDVMGPLIATTPDQRLKSLYAQSLAQHLGLDIKTIWRSLHSPKGQKIDYSSTHKTADQENDWQGQQALRVESYVPEAELMVIAIVVNDPKYLRILEERGILMQFSSKKISYFLKKLQDMHRHGPINLDNLLTDLWGFEANEIASDKNIYLRQNRQLLEFISDIGRNEDQSQINKLFEDALRRIQECFLKEQGREKQARMVQNEQEDTQILKQFMDIQRTKHGLKSTV